MEIIQVADSVIVDNVDLHGFCGRDFHPEPHHIGMKGLVLAVTTENGEEGPEYTYTFFTVQMETGELLELMDFEVVKNH